MQNRENVYKKENIDKRTIEEIGRVLSLVYRRQYEMIGERLKAIGISALHSVVLINIFRHPGLNQKELAELISIDKATVSRILNSLDPKAYIKRSPDASDHRYNKLYLTGLGKEVVQKSMDIQVGMWLEILNEIPQSDRENIMNGLHILGNCFGFSD